MHPQKYLNISSAAFSKKRQLNMDFGTLDVFPSQGKGWQKECEG